MPDFTFTVVVNADTQDQANRVMVERIYYDEKYDDEETGKPFDYTVKVEGWT